MGLTANRILGLILITAVLLAGGCKSASKVRTTEVNDVLIDALIEHHNERVQHIDRVWARVSVRIKGTDSQGKGFEEQGEGHLQVTQPDSVSLSIGKLGETYFAYGSNAERYWMFDLSNSDHRVSLVGAIANLTAERAGEIGLSVHPGDLISSLGIEPIDADGLVEARWELGVEQVVLSVPSRWGVNEYWFDPSTGLVMRVISLGASGEEIAVSELSRYKPLLGEQRLETSIKVPGKVEVSRAGLSGEYVRIELSEPSQRAIKPMVYNPDRLARAYRVHEMIDLDQPAENSSPANP